MYMGVYCDICGVKDKEYKNPEGITKVTIQNYVNDKWYSAHEGNLCFKCREDVFCFQDKMPSKFKDIDYDD